MSLTTVEHEVASAEVDALEAWTSRVTDLRADVITRAVTHHDEGGDWLEMPRPAANLPINACACGDAGWHIAAEMDYETMTADIAETAAKALRAAALEVRALNAQTLYELDIWSVTDAVKMLGQTVPVFAMVDDSGWLNVRVDRGNIWADKCTHPGARWTFDRCRFMFINWFEVVGITATGHIQIAEVTA